MFRIIQLEKDPKIIKELLINNDEDVFLLRYKEYPSKGEGIIRRFDSKELSAMQLRDINEALNADDDDVIFIKMERD